MKNITFCLLMLYSFTTQAQLIVSNTVETPAQLVQNVLVDVSVSPTNIKFNGSAATANLVRDQASHFTTNFNPTNLGVDAGVLLTTGKGQAALGPNNSGNFTLPPAFPVAGDPDLAILAAGNTVQNAAVLEFDFIATGLELNFDYVFASEEYPEFSNSAFNDAFGFFLSGPGIAGPFTNGAKNIALIPSSTIPITINNVNNGTGNTGPCDNCIYYVANGTGTTPAANPTIQYDGFTTLLRATSALICGETYHIKLAVANVSDNAYDSAVFLKNFKITPLELLDNFNLPENLGVCFGQTVTINSGLTQGTNIFEWFDGAGVLIPGETTPSLSVTLPGTYTLVVRTDYGCEIARDDITIGFLPEIPATEPLPLNLCTLNPAPYVFPTIDQTALMMGTVPNAATEYEVYYYSSSFNDALDDTGIGLIPTSAFTNYTIPTATATIWVRIYNVFTDCVIVKSFTLNASPSPSGVFSYPGTPYCAALPQQLVTTTVTPGGVYSATPAGLTLDATTGNIVPSTSTPGIYTVSYNLAASGSCPAFSPTPVTVEIVATPAAPVVVTPLTYCQGETAAVLSAVGTNLLWYTAALGGTGSVTAPTPTTASGGTQIYYVSQTNGCEGPRTPITVNINLSPAAPTFNSVAPYCQNATAVPLTATGNNLIWYADATTTVGSATAPTPSTAVGGTINYYVTQTVNNCESARVAIPVTVVALPAAPTVVSPINYCQNVVPAALNATGTGLLWYTLATGGVGNPVMPTVNTTATGTTNYYVSQTVSGCEGPRALIAVTVGTIPLAPAVTSPLTYCQDLTVLPLTATGSNLLWYTDATTGTGTAIAPTPITTAPGSTTYYVSQTVGCESLRVPIIVNITPTPAAPDVSPISYCQNAITAPLTTNSGTNLLWYANAIGGTGSATAPSPSSASSGLTSYFVTQTVNGCESPRASLAVTVISLPAAPTVTPQLGYCQGAVAPSLAASATGTGLLWYPAAVGGTGNAVAPLPNTATLGNSNYYVSQTVNGCEGPRALITVTVFPIPATPVTVVGAITCATTTGTITVNSPLGVNFEYSINNGTTYQSSTNFTGVALGTTYDVLVRNTLSGCVSAVAQTVVGPALATPANPTASVTFNANCITPTSTIEVSGPLGPTLQYSINGGTSYQSSTTFSGLTPNAAYTIFVRNTASGCDSGSIVVNVNPIPANPAAPTLTVIQPTCNTPTGTINVTSPAGTNLEYSIDGGVTYQSGTSFAGLAPNANYSIIVRNSVTGCVSLASVATVNPIPANPAIPAFTAIQPTCSINTGSFTITAPVGANFQYSNNGGTTYQNGVTFSGLTAGTTYNPIVKDILTGCISAPASVVISPALNVPVAPTMSTTVQPICSAPTGVIIVTAPTGANLSYSINGGVTFQASTTFAGLTPGNYNVIVKDNVSTCTSSASSATVNQLPANPAAPTASATFQPICTTPTGTIVITAPIGSDLVYSINGGTTYQAGTTFAALAPNATYSLTVRNTITGCISVASQVIILPIPANPIAPTGTITQPTCNAPTGAISITAPIGANLEYSINGGTTYQSTTSFGSLAAGTTYAVTVRNTLTGCISAAGSFVILPAPTFPATPVANGSDVCVDDSITLSTPAVVGATYSWTGPNGFLSTDQNPIIPNATISMSGTYSVVIATTSDCPSLPGTVTIVVNPIPVPTLAQNGNICYNVETNAVLNPFTLNAGLSDTDYDFVWYLENASGFDPIIGANMSTYVATAPGIYGVIATNSLTGCVSQLVTAPISMTSPPLQITGIASEYFADLQSIAVNVLPIGDYEYQMDNGAWQSSNVFIDVLSGTHTVRVRNECGMLEDEAYILDYPRFFTPNGDGYNDTWNIFELNSQPNSKIYIFDRYGKLLKEISPSGIGWDGTYNNQILPATDYWFIVHYEENNVNKVFKSHFAIKR